MLRCWLLLEFCSVGHPYVERMRGQQSERHPRRHEHRHAEQEHWSRHLEQVHDSRSRDNSDPHHKGHEPAARSRGAQRARIRISKTSNPIVVSNHTRKRLPLQPVGVLCAHRSLSGSPIGPIAWRSVLTWRARTTVHSVQHDSWPLQEAIDPEATARGWTSRGTHETVRLLRPLDANVVLRVWHPSLGTGPPVGGVGVPHPKPAAARA